MLRLDPIDCRILNELDKNGRESFSAVAKRLRLSSDAVLYHFTKLKSEGVIERSAPLVDLSKLGLLLFRVSGKMKNGENRNLSNTLLKHTQFFLVAETRGQHDFIVWGASRSLETIVKSSDFVRGALGNSLRELSIELITETTAYSRGYLVNRPGHIFPARGGDLERAVDEIELKILEELSADSRVPVTEIADRLDLTPAIVRYRIERLEREQIILGYRLHLNTEKIGIQRFRAPMELSHADSAARFSKLCAQIPSIIRYERQIGVCSVEIGLEVEDFAAMHKVLDQVCEEMKGQAQVMGTDFFRSAQSAKRFPWSELRSEQRWRRS